MYQKQGNYKKKKKKAFIFYKCIATLKTRKPEPNQKADNFNLDLNSIFPPAKSENQGHYCVAFQGSDTHPNPVEKDQGQRTQVLRVKWGTTGGRQTHCLCGIHCIRPITSVVKTVSITTLLLSGTQPTPTLYMVLTSRGE